MKRFYSDVGIQNTDAGWQVTLDGRGIKTAKGANQIVPSENIAKAIAAEWDNQPEKIDTSAFILRDLTDYTLDIITPDTAATINKLIAFAETDTLCYRADPDEAFFARQEAVWDPIIEAIETRIGIHFTRISGIIHQPQPTETLAKLRNKLERLDPFSLAGLENLTSIAASLCIGLTAMDLAKDADTGPQNTPVQNTPVQALIDASNLEELWQEEMWGEDAEATAHRTLRGQEFFNAFNWAKLIQET